MDTNGRKSVRKFKLRIILVPTYAIACEGSSLGFRDGGALGIMLTLGFWLGKPLGASLGPLDSEGRALGCEEVVG